MRNKGKITTQRSRDFGKTEKTEKIVKDNPLLFFAMDNTVSSRILAVLHKGVSKRKISFHTSEKESAEYTDKKGVKRTKIVRKSVIKKVEPEIEKFQVVCGSNGKVGTWYNTITSPADNVSEKDVTKVKKRILVGRRLSNKEVLELFPKQCPLFQKIFAKEYQAIIASK